METDLFGTEIIPPKKRLKKVAVKKAITLNQFPIDEPKTEYIGQNIYIRPTYIVSMPEYSRAKSYTSQAFIKNKENLKDNSHKGKVSEKAQKEIKNCVSWLVASAKQKTLYHKESKKYYTFKVNFITLTLPDTYEEITEKAFKENLLNPFLTNLRVNYGLNNYVWKLELQKNGKIHIHLTTDTFLYWKDIRRVWNKRLLKNGYLNKFHDDFGHYDPNSTDVHAVHKINDIAAYVSKYMSKNEGDMEKIKGKIWSANYELTRNSKPKVFVDRHACMSELRHLMQKEVKYKPIQTVPDALGSVRTIGDMFFIKRINWLMHIKGVIKDVYTDTCYKIRNLIDPTGFNPLYSNTIPLTL